MIEPNWNIFRAKFDNPQDSFEWLCYSLFCREFKKSYGIFRYKNQSAVETDPINKNGEVIGWQAKFYDTALGAHVPELMKTLETAKRDYPDITKIIVYTNSEWGQDRGKEPKGKKEVEEKSKTLGIDLDWRTASYFESPFVSVENEIIAKHFFTLDKSVFALMEEMEAHTENILDQIQTCIEFGVQKIEIDRGRDLERIKSASERVLILSGVGGVGKTALVKNLYEQTEEKTPFYVFKATEFELRDINEFFRGYNVQEFLKAHEDEADKIIVIDSSEKLLDLSNTDPFKELLSVLLKADWKIVFTTRDNYLEDLNFEFFEIYKIAPLNINIRNLTLEELRAISDQNHFLLPKDEKLLELVRNPFYLSEYLKSLKENEEISYADFKAKLWTKIIRRSRPAREQCFLRIAFQRANDGQFFVNPDCESHILDGELKKDGIIGYESPHGYFITQDIYEEWALEKIIEAEFGKKSDNATFFQNIGRSLPVRRAFRNWLSEKLALDDTKIGVFIEEVTKDETIEVPWRDEILVSVLLSDYSDTFFGLFKDAVLANNQELLRKLTFLLRIACKEVDDDFFKRLGVKNLDLFTLKYVFTKPKGEGWNSLIKFVFENIQQIGVQNIHFVLPVIHDWSGKFKTGETTKLSGLIALQYYQWTIKEDVYLSRDETKEHLLQTICYCASEIKNELEEIFKEVLKNKWKNHRDPYYDLSEASLTKFEGLNVSQILPLYILQLADLFWTFTPKDHPFYSRPGIGVEQYFDMEDEHLEYFPASSYQTPIYWLLQTSLKETVDFILRFTNKAVEYFAKTEFAKYEVEEVEVHVEREKPIKQFIGNRLWCMHRGTQVCPHALESMHMALEKFFLEKGKDIDSKTLQAWLLYLLKNSKSSSISSVVASIVMAYPEKTFDIAKILFRTKKFFFYDTGRFVLDQGQKSSLLMLKNGFGFNSKNEVHENERLDACDAKHRKWTLENLLVNYQLFRREETSESESEKRQKTLWGILDEYYKELPNPPSETESENTWRLYLARMDTRKMNPVPEKAEDGYVIHLNPEIEPKLKEYSEKSQEESSRPMKYTSLMLWANYRLKNDEKYKQYKQYEDDPTLAFREVNEVISELGKTKAKESMNLQDTREVSFRLLNHSIPAEVCSLLVRDYSEKLSKEEVEFCAGIVLETASSASGPSYQYQAMDGTQAAISVLPILLEKYPEEKGRIKEILLFDLFNCYPVDMAGTCFNVFAVMAIQRLWNSRSGDAQSILIGYLVLKPKYDALREKVRRENYEKKKYDVDENDVMSRFVKENKKVLQKIRDNELLLDDVGDIRQTDLYTLKTAFQLIPVGTKSELHKSIVKDIFSCFAEKLFLDDRKDRIDYKVKHDFLERFAYFVLNAPREDVQGYMRQFLDGFNGSEVIADMFKEFISAEDQLDAYENFWEVWNLFEEKVVGLCQEGCGYGYVDRIVESYLFGQNHWKESASEWHTFKEEDTRFFKEMSEKIGHCTATLYSISKLLNGIGSSYLDDGVSWLSRMLQNNKTSLSGKLETNTLYYLENLVRKYAYVNREKIKRVKELKQNVLTILDFLILRGSVVGYMLRENIL